MWAHARTCGRPAQARERASARAVSRTPPLALLALSLSRSRAREGPMAKWLISQLNCFTEKPSLAPPPPPTELGAALLEEGDDRTSNAVISELAALPAFTALATAEGDAIASATRGRLEARGGHRRRDREGRAEKGLSPRRTKGAARALGKGSARSARAAPPLRPRAQIDVLGKTADAVAVEILTSIGSAARSAPSSTASDSRARARARPSPSSRVACRTR